MLELWGRGGGWWDDEMVGLWGRGVDGGMMRWWDCGGRGWMME